MSELNEKDKIYWARWFQPTEDHRPITYPPNENIIGWWCTGENSHGDAVICSIVRAKTKKDALKKVQKDWPEAEDFDFCDEKTDLDFLGARFPVGKEWSEPRVNEVKRLLKI